MYRSVFITLCVVLLAVVSPIDACTPWTVETPVKNPAERCKYYTCLAEKFKCPNDKKTNYLKDYGLKLCTDLSKVATSASVDLRKWTENALQCLQASLVQFDTSPTPDSLCEKLSDAAWDAHAACYVKPEASICKLNEKDKKQVTKIIERKGFKSTKPSIDIAKACGDEKPKGGAEKPKGTKGLVTRIKSLIKPGQGKSKTPHTPNTLNAPAANNPAQPVAPAAPAPAEGAPAEAAPAEAAPAEATPAEAAPATF